MADRGDTHYHVSKLNLWFAFSSLVLLVSAFWMVIDDWNRPWKQYQKEFRRIEIQRAREQLAAVDAQEALAAEERLLQEHQEALQRLETENEELAEALNVLRGLEAQQYIDTEAEKKAKQNFNWERFLVDEFRAHHPDDDEGYARRLASLKVYEDEMLALGNAKKASDAAVNAQKQVIAGIRSNVVELEVQMKAATKDIDLVRKKLATLDPADVPTQVANVIRDFPGLDFIGPSLLVDKVMPPNLTFELNFTKKPRIDMCKTCHVAIDRAGFENEPQPFTTHPDLDLYLTAKSPHPVSQFGCTICHRGAGEALDFQRADHRPTDEEEGHRWYEEYHWHKQHYWDYPMLSSKYIEASCVQCHKDTLELIEPAAPKVVEGEHLFERYGCYACHKVEGYPTKRRPGPSLKTIAQKTTRDFVDAWIESPKSFRPSTWMPQIFHLENYGPDVKVVNSNFGQDRPMMGDEWSDAAVASVAAFIWGRSEQGEAPPVPEEGDADRGRELFRLSGCLACHNMAPFPGEAPAEFPEDEEYTGPDDIFDLAKRDRETNEHGPNLRGIASKVNPEWLFAWIKNPSAYWSETRMPDLRLPDQDIADIVAYVFEDPDGMFTDTPEQWEPDSATYERDVLEEQARWFFNRTLPSELERRFQDEWADDQALLEAVGERWVLNQGCHSCHEISGLEAEQPIGTELTTWASKTIDKLDFGFLPEILAEKHDWTYHEKTEFKQYRENFLEWKLRSPRIYDRRKVKNPTERLRMPWFDLDEDQIEAIVCFVAGLVEDEVQRAKMVPTEAELAMSAGLRTMRQKNCASCHLIEPALIEFHDENGDPHRVRGQFYPIDEDFDPLPPPTTGNFQDWLANYEERYEDEVPEVLIKLLEPAPGFGEPNESVVVTDPKSIRIVESAWGGDLVPIIIDWYMFEEDVEDVDGERRPYGAELYEKLRWTFAPPVLLDEGVKLQREWFYRFLLDPTTLRHQVRVKMPTFDWKEDEAGWIADYFAHKAHRDWPSRYAKKLLVAEELTPSTLVEKTAELNLRLKEESVADIVAGTSELGLGDLVRFGDEIGFRMDARIDPAYEPIPQRSPAVLGPLLADDEDFFETIHTLVTDTTGRGPNCVQCHFLRGDPPTQTTPVAWAPDLDHTRERLRPEWVRQWLIDPAKIYPGTAMPANFALDSTQWQEIYPKPSAEQIEAVLIWLYNLDRAGPRN